MITLPNDFEGFYNVSHNCYDVRDLELFIEEFEPEYLCKVLGKVLSDALNNELEANGGVLPPLSRFIPLFQPLCLGCSTQKCCCSKKKPSDGWSIGLKKVLLGLLYYDYVIQQKHQNTVTGTVNSNNETSNLVSNLTQVRLAEQRWNRSVLSIDAIQKYIQDNPTLYPEVSNYCSLGLKHYPLI